MNELPETGYQPTGRFFQQLDAKIRRGLGLSVEGGRRASALPSQELELQSRLPSPGPKRIGNPIN
jgi:hypothetical protein